MYMSLEGVVPPPPPPSRADVYYKGSESCVVYRASGQIVPAVMQPPPLPHLSYLLPEKNWERGGKEGAVGEIRQKWV